MGSSFLDLQKAGDANIIIMKFLYLSLYCLYFVNEAKSGDVCNSALGMQQGTIKDSQLRASSTFQHHSVGARRGRLNSNVEGGAWCPKSYVSKHGSEYLEIDLEGLFYISGVITQGRHANGMGQEYAEYYMLEYQSFDSDEYKIYTGNDGNVILQGNTDTNTESKVMLDEAVIATKVRIIPYSQHLRTVCMRVELLGCKVEEVETSEHISKVAQQHNEQVTETISGNEDKTPIGTRSLGVLTGVLSTMILFLLVIVALLLKRRSSSNLKKSPSLGSVYTSGSVLERKYDIMEEGAYTLERKYQPEPIYQEPSLVKPALCEYSTPISVIYTRPMCEVYSVYQTPSYLKESLTDISYLEESSVDSGSSNGGTPRLPPLPNFEAVPFTTPIYVNHTEL